MEAIGAYGQGLIDLEELHRAECHGLPGSRRLGKPGTVEDFRLLCSIPV